MSPLPHTRFLAVLAAVACALGSAGAADAAWVTIKNDTGKTIIVQEVVVKGGQVKRGKPTTLMPGESVREFLPGPGAKQVEVFDARNPDKALWGGALGCKGESQTFSVAVAGGKVGVNPAKK